MRTLIDRLKGVATDKRLPNYLEDTVNAAHLYERLGWKVIDDVEMLIDTGDGMTPVEL